MAVVSRINVFSCVQRGSFGWERDGFEMMDIAGYVVDFAHRLRLLLMAWGGRRLPY